MTAASPGRLRAAYIAYAAAINQVADSPVLDGLTAADQLLVLGRLLGGIIQDQLPPDTQKAAVDFLHEQVIQGWKDKALGLTPIGGEGRA